MAVELTRKSLAARIDFANLKPGLDLENIERTVDTAILYWGRGICVHPVNINLIYVRWLASKLMSEAERDYPKMISVANFPSGENAFSTIYNELEWLYAQLRRFRCVLEADLVFPASFFKRGNPNKLMGILRFAQSFINTKVIVETGRWSETDIREITEIIREAGVFCWKSSTGILDNIGLDDKIRHCQIAREILGPDFCIKVAGGLRTLEDIKRCEGEIGGNLIYGITWNKVPGILKQLSE